MRIEVFAPDALAPGAADLITDLLSEEATTFGLAGGSTPRAAYRELRNRDVPWDRLTCWFPDERWVPPEDPDANLLMARRSLLDHVPVRFIAPDTTLDDPAVAASIYETALEGEFTNGPDVVLLGMGDDGHTASLFPGTDALATDRSAYVANWVPRFNTWRLTATVPLLQRARNIVFLVGGGSKARILRRILVDGEPLPAGVVAAGAADVTWLLDRDAAAEL